MFLVIYVIYGNWIRAPEAFRYYAWTVLSIWTLPLLLSSWHLLACECFMAPQSLHLSLDIRPQMVYLYMLFIKIIYHTLFHLLLSSMNVSQRPGSEIVLHEVLQCESDLPAQCFTDLYLPGAGMSCDYFTCIRCKVNCEFIFMFVICSSIEESNFRRKKVSCLF